MPVISCDVCGITSDIKKVCYRKRFGRVLCDKHAAQMSTKGKITDPTPYCCFDRNEWTEKEDVIEMVLRNRAYDVVGIVQFDKRFKDQIIGRKWRPVWKSPSYYAATIGLPEEHVSHMYMHRYIMQLAGSNISGCEVDHINGNTFDNRLCNLRLADRQLQMFNVSPRSDGQIPIRGVCYSNTDHTYRTDIMVRKRRYHFRRFQTLEEAVYARYIAEMLLIGDVAIARHYDSFLPYIERLSQDQKDQLQQYVRDQLSA